jgi:hypothetical protein
LTDALGGRALGRGGCLPKLFHNLLRGRGYFGSVAFVRSRFTEQGVEVAELEIKELVDAEGIGAISATIFPFKEKQNTAKVFFSKARRDKFCDGAFMYDVTWIKSAYGAITIEDGL